jgi:hypothetical protein
MFCYPSTNIISYKATTGFDSSTPPKTTSSDESNAVHQGAASNIPVVRHNSAGTSQGQSSSRNEDPESKRLSLSLWS